jgi:hypothetical protein
MALPRGRSDVAKVLGQRLITDVSPNTELEEQFEVFNYLELSGSRNGHSWPNKWCRAPCSPSRYSFPGKYGRYPVPRCHVPGNTPIWVAGTAKLSAFQTPILHRSCQSVIPCTTAIPIVGWCLRKNWSPAFGAESNSGSDATRYP